MEEANKLRDEKSRLQQRLESNKKSLEENKAQLEGISKKLQRIGSSASVIERLDMDIKQAVSCTTPFCCKLYALCKLQ